MDDMGYEFLPKVSYEGIKHEFTINQILPNGGSITVENLYGERIITSRSYIEKYHSQDIDITHFNTVDHYVNYSYTSYTKSIYSYSDNYIRNNVFRWIGLSYNAYSGDINNGGNFIFTRYSWNNITDPELLKLKGK
jgi:hypothetical protein